MLKHSRVKEKRVFFTKYIDLYEENNNKMSRSYLKNKIVGYTTKESEKRDKTIANKRFRRLVKVRVAKRIEVLPLVREVSNIYQFDKDGKHYYSKMTKLEMRK